MLEQVPVEILSHILSYSTSRDLVNLSCCSREYNTTLEPFVWHTLSIPLKHLFSKRFHKRHNDKLKNLRHVRMLKLNYFHAAHYYHNTTIGNAGEAMLQNLISNLDYIAEAGCRPTIVHTGLVPSHCGIGE